MRVVLASSEAVPLSKTGGLADVATGLGKALSAAGHEVTLVTPHYPQLAPKNSSTLSPTGERIRCEVGGEPIEAELLRTRIDDTLDTIVVSSPGLFDRPAVYGDSNGPYQDNCKRYCFFSRAVLEASRVLNLRPEVIHANDWQTALLGPLVQIEERPKRNPGLAVVLTIHNLAFQGQFWQWDMRLTGLDWSHFNWTELEYYGELNLLKGGIVFADQVTTVSPTYAEEIQTPSFGCGLEGVLKTRVDSLHGILNGVDMSVWNPSTDPHLPKTYDVDSAGPGKAACKSALQEEMGLSARDDVPLVGLVSRLTDQKGLDLVMNGADRLLGTGCQFVFLGTGDSQFETFLSDWAAAHPDQVAARIGFSEALAHRIEAGSDLFLMPSRFEPCGLNQMYSQAYGTPPVVSRVGGLADSVVDCYDGALHDGTGTGFVMHSLTVDGLIDAVGRARELFKDTAAFARLRRNAMTQDWSWSSRVPEYETIYELALAGTRGA